MLEDKLKKKILFHYSILNVGGAEMSVLRLTKCLVDKGWDVELVCTTKGGNLEEKVDKRVRLRSLRSFIAGGKFKESCSWFTKLLNLPDLLLYIFTRVEQSIKEFIYFFKSYDVAVISLHGLSPKFCCQYVKATKTLHWIRNDLSSCDKKKKAYNNIIKYKDRTDSYICVSKTVKESFDKVFPSLSKKAHVVYNVIDPKQMLEALNRSSNPFKNDMKFKVLSVCRLDDNSKAVFRLVDIFKKLSVLNYDFTWYILGDGPDRAKLELKIKDEGFQKNIILLGTQKDPFPYYKYCDLVAVVSYYEGLCGVINEAKVSKKSVLVAEVSGVHEQIESGVNGHIVNNDLNSIVNGFINIFSDKSSNLLCAVSPLKPDILDDEKKISNLITVIEQGDNKSGK